MSRLVASYATDRYVARMIQPDSGSLYYVLNTESPSGSSLMAGASWELFEQTVDAMQSAEERYWQSLLSQCKPEDRALFLSSWEHFRAYAGLPAPDPKGLHSGNDHPQDGGGSDERAEEEA